MMLYRYYKSVNGPWLNDDGDSGTAVITLLITILYNLGNFIEIIPSLKFDQCNNALQILQVGEWSTLDNHGHNQTAAITILIIIV